jgi:hypothetical protein
MGMQAFQIQLIGLWQLPSRLRDVTQSTYAIAHDQLIPDLRQQDDTLLQIALGLPQAPHREPDVAQGGQRGVAQPYVVQIFAAGVIQVVDTVNLGP